MILLSHHPIHVSSKLVNSHEKDNDYSQQPISSQAPENPHEYFTPPSIPLSLRILTDYTFEHDTQSASGSTTGDWLILFYDAVECDDSCQSLINIAGEVSEKIKAGMGEGTRLAYCNLAVVEIGKNEETRARFKFNEDAMSVRMFSGGLMYSYDFDDDADMSLQSMIYFINHFADVSNNIIAVPRERDILDKLMMMVSAMRSSLLAQHNSNTTIFVVVTGAVVLIVLVFFVTFRNLLTSQTKPLGLPVSQRRRSLKKKD